MCGGNYFQPEQGQQLWSEATEPAGGESDSKEGLYGRLLVHTVLDTPVQRQSGLEVWPCPSTVQGDTSEQTEGFIADPSHKPTIQEETLRILNGALENGSPFYNICVLKSTFFIYKSFALNKSSRDLYSSRRWLGSCDLEEVGLRPSPRMR